MSIHQQEPQGRTGLAPSEPQTLSEYAARVKTMGDDELQANMEEMAKAEHTGSWGRERHALLVSELQHRRKHRRGERGAV
jgi:hypothetical protein